MKICPKCKSEVEDNFDICWNCQYSFEEKRVVESDEFKTTCPKCNMIIEPDFEFCPNCFYKLGLDSVPRTSKSYEGPLKNKCLRCSIPMFFKGNFKFHEGTRVGAIGNIFELLTNRESFDLYFCPKCGKIEFFLPFVEEEYPSSRENII